MDEELKGLFTSMANSLHEIRGQIIGARADSRNNNSMSGVSSLLVESNTLLRTINQNLINQLNFMKLREKEREFEADSKVTADKDEKSTKDINAEKSMDKGAGGILQKIGIGLGAIATGLSMLGRPMVFVGIAALGLLIVTVGAALAVLGKFFASSIGELLYAVLYSIGSAIIDLGVRIGENKDALMAANDVILDFVGGMMDIFSKFLKDIRPIIQDILDFMADLITDLMEILVDGLVEVIEALEPWFDRFMDSFDNLVDKLAPILRDLIKSFDNLINKLAPIIHDIIGLVETFMEQVGPIILAVIDLFDDLVNGIKDIMLTLIPEIRPIIQEIGNLIDTFGENIRSTIETIGSTIESLVTTVFGSIQDTATSFGNTIEGVVDSILGGIANIIETIGDTINSVLDNTTRNITELSEIDGSAMRDTAAGISAIAGAIALFAGASLGSAAAGLGEAAVNGLSKLFGGEGSVLEQLKSFADVGPALDTAAEAMERLRDVILDFQGTDFTGAGGFADFADSMFDNAEKIADGMDKILGAGLIGSPGSPEERIRLLETLSDLSSSNAVSGSPRNSGSRLSSESSRVDSMSRESANVPSMSNIQSENISESFNTNQVYISNPGAVEATLDRILVTDEG